MSDSTGLIEISSYQDLFPSADVVFVHGLGGDAITTWHPQGKRDDHDCWLGWLGKDHLCVNIWSFGYDAEATNWKSHSSMPLFDQASNLLEWLDTRELGERPLIFIAHSMGGLLVKKMLNSALTFQKQAILEQTKGIVFLATPHTGSHLASLIDNIGVLAQTTVSVKELKAHSPQLRELNEWYREHVRSLGIATKVYYETQLLQGILVVDEDSANPGIEKVKPVAIEKNHIDLCKPESQNSLVYLGVKKFIKECLNIPGWLDNSNGIRGKKKLNPPTNIINPATPYSIEGFELSWNNLPPEAQQLGCLLSLFAPAPFQWSLVESCVIETEDDKESEDKVEDLKKLRNRYLVDGNLLQLTKQKTYQLHRRIREFFQTKLAQLPEADCDKQRFCQTMVAVAKKIPKTPTRDDIAAVTPAIPHLAEAATVLTDWLRDEDLTWPFVGLGRFYYGKGTYDQSESWYEQCLEITRSRLGKEHPDVATILNNLANLYQYLGGYDQAEALYQQALEIRKHWLGEKHPYVAESLNNLAVLYYFQGHYDQAEPLIVQSLEMRKLLLGQNHPDVAESLNNLAVLYYLQGHYDQAKPLIVQSLEMKKQLLGADHPDVATSLNNLGGLYNYMGRYDQAEPLLQQALEMRKQLLGQNHPDVAESLNNLGLLYESMGRYDQAEPLLQQALEMRKQLLGQNHPDVATSLSKLAELYHYLRRYAQAKPLYQQALEIRKQLLGHDHPDVATSLKNLAELYWSEGRYNQAETLIVQALEIAEGRLGSNHPKTVTIRKTLKHLHIPVFREITPMIVQLYVGLKSWFPH
ncbi:tetratricopeptide repeat protein [Moorena producens JHB]|uniref:Tetratricopeptide repeat protein n=1 Tax=Moorena producens (strain JHB) TaxID=1454205 RepID=A0A1D9G0I9_MOOP1|nr:tetratricopeptide repeat protein [Moorena producens]AOY81091.2 tetratricopeptide repeat protein [Moorena producens JHB]